LKTLLLTFILCVSAFSLEASKTSPYTWMDGIPSVTTTSLDRESAADLYNYCTVYFKEGEFVYFNHYLCNLIISNNVYDLVHFHDPNDKWCLDEKYSHYSKLENNQWKKSFLVQYRNEETVMDVIEKILNLYNKCDEEEQ